VYQSKKKGKEKCDKPTNPPNRGMWESVGKKETPEREGRFGVGTSGLVAEDYRPR
jgi:hypothetical protein